METKILAISGKKGSGKNTAANFILGFEMSALGIVQNEFRITDKGQLWISDIFGDKEGCGVFDPTRKDDYMLSFLDEYIHPYIKLYSYADWIKKIAIEVLGLKLEQVYGTDKQKNTKTHLKWQDMPGICSDKKLWELFGDKFKDYLVYHPKGPMTAREVMQYLGTEIFRRMYANVWVDATFRQIKKDSPKKAIITDLRFPNEFEGCEANDVKTLRLTRFIDAEDAHASETLLNEENFDWNRFSHVMDNINMTIAEQNKELLDLLYQWGWYTHKKVTNEV